MIAALYVQTGGAYFGLPGVDPWDEIRDARGYEGPHPVVAHPPCSRWCQLAYVNQKRYGHRVGDDGGCFEAALFSVRRWGGVLEHPAYSHAWKAFDLTRPPKEGGWVRCKSYPGAWVCQVSQRVYGHRARKRTWLYWVGPDYATRPPELIWGDGEDPEAQVSFCKNHGNSPLPRLSKKEAKATPPAFRELLLDLANQTGRKQKR